MVPGRQVRRVLQQELGVSRMELLQARRLLLAKQLLTETALSVIEVAFASGLSSLRRFNNPFAARCQGTLRRLPPHPRSPLAPPRPTSHERWPQEAEESGRSIE